MIRRHLQGRQRSAALGLVLLFTCYAPAVGGCRDPSVRLSVPPGPGQATTAVRIRLRTDVEPPQSAGAYRLAAR